MNRALPVLIAFLSVVALAVSGYTLKRVTDFRPAKPPMQAQPLRPSSTRTPTLPPQASAARYRDAFAAAKKSWIAAKKGTTKTFYGGIIFDYTSCDPGDADCRFKPLPNKEFTLWYEDKPINTFATDSQGRFGFEVKPGDLYLSIPGASRPFFFRRVPVEGAGDAVVVSYAELVKRTASKSTVAPAPAPKKRQSRG